MIFNGAATAAVKRESGNWLCKLSNNLAKPYFSCKFNNGHDGNSQSMSIPSKLYSPTTDTTLFTNLKNKILILHV